MAFRDFLNIFKRSPVRQLDVVSGNPGEGEEKPLPVTPRVARSIKNIKMKTVAGQQVETLAGGYRSVGRTEHKPEYSLSEPFLIADTESIVARVFDRMVTISWKEGWRLESQNPEAVKYVKKRIHEMTLIKWETFISTIKDAYRDLVQCSNCFILKVRDSDLSSGKQHKLGGKELEPIAALEVIDPTTMFPIRYQRKDGTFGPVLGWVQIIDDQEYRRYSLKDIIHITYNRKPSSVFGTPLTVPVADDIRSLRRNEEYVDIVSAKSAFPTFSYKVGDEESGPAILEGGLSEMDFAESQLLNMSQEGVILMPGHHTIESIDISKSYVNVLPFIEYFRRRVVTGLGASLLDIGEGESANRATGAVISQNLIDLMHDVQEAFEAKLSLELFQELLLEAGTVTRQGKESDKFPLSAENYVTFQFNEIDQEAKRSKENHYLNIVEKSLITMTEFRQEIGRKPLSEEDYADLYFNKVMLAQETATIEAQGEVDTKVAKVAKVNGTTGNKSRPANQHGKRATSPSKKTRKDCLDEFRITDSKGVPSVYTDVENSVLSWVKARPKDITQEYKKDLKQRVRTYMTVMAKNAGDSLETMLSKAISDGMSDFYSTGDYIHKLKPTDYTAEARKVAQENIDNLFVELRSKIESTIDSIEKVENPVADIKAIFEVSQFRSTLINNAEISTSRNFGYALAAKANGIYDLSWTKRGNCGKCGHLSQDMNVLELSYNMVRASQPNCSDTLRIK